MDSEFIQVIDSQGVELQIGDKVLVSLGKYFAQRLIADVQLNDRYPRHSKVLIYSEDNPTTKRWTYSYRVVKYEW